MARAKQTFAVRKDDDYYAWLLGQAQTLRRIADKVPSLDCAEIAEELEGMARSDEHALESFLERLLKLLSEMALTTPPTKCKLASIYPERPLGYSRSAGGFAQLTCHAAHLGRPRLRKGPPFSRRRDKNRGTRMGREIPIVVPLGCR